jgi:hypothetical protein
MPKWLMLYQLMLKIAKHLVFIFNCTERSNSMSLCKSCTERSNSMSLCKSCTERSHIWSHISISNSFQSLNLQEMSLLSYLYSQLSARQWWVFVFIGSADTLYLEKGANTAQLSKIEEWVIFYNWATHDGL